MGGMRGTVLERFERSYMPVTECGCWIWLKTLGADQHDAYGKITMPGGAQKRAHVLSYELHKGPVPKGSIVRHTCDIPCCVNPGHLLLGTKADNTADCVARDRHLYGGRSPRAKLTAKEVRAIRKDRRQYKTIAAEYGIGISTVGGIKTKLRWKHL